MNRATTDGAEFVIIQMRLRMLFIPWQYVPNSMTKDEIFQRLSWDISSFQSSTHIAVVIIESLTYILLVYRLKTLFEVRCNRL